MTLERPLFHLSQSELIALYPRINSDLVRLTAYVYELQFRSTMDKTFKASALEQLLTLQTQSLTAVKKIEALPAVEPTHPTPGFVFPTTSIEQIRRKLMSSRFAGKSWHDVGLLKVSGYAVGCKEGKSTRERRGILNWIFLQDELRDIDDPSYAKQWGDPKSATRLKKLADSLAAFARNAQRSPNDMRVAIQEWKDDLDYLYHTFYQQWHKFPWPEVET